MKNRNTVLIATLSAVVCFALLPKVQAAPAPENPDPVIVGGSLNTADGKNALANVTGAGNSAFGWFSLFSNTDGNFNTAVGAGTLIFNVGDPAAFEGIENTAVGTAALLFNTIGEDNNAVGVIALENNDNGDFNNAFGHGALTANFDGDQNNAMGDLALNSNVSGSFNTAVGDDALLNCTGDSNTAVGDEAGANLTTGDQNVYIGKGVSAGAVDELRFIRIGNTTFTDYDCFIAGIVGRAVDAGTAAFVFVDGNQKLGTVPIDAAGNTVKPQVMLNEALKQQQRIAELEGTVARLAATVKEQAAQIQKVSAQIEMSKPAPQVVANKP